MKLIANMVGRNEADRYLEEVLEHTKSFVDLIVFTDDASDDRTFEIASRHAATYTMPEPTFAKDEAALRQASWDNLSNYAEDGDWILALDCDEKLYAAKPNVDLTPMLEQDQYNIINVTFFHMWNENQFRLDKLWAPTPSTRLFRYREGGTFRDRKLACGAEPSYVAQEYRRTGFMQPSMLVMQHLGYARDDDKKAKYERYMHLDGGAYHNIKHLESILDPGPSLAEFKAFEVTRDGK